DGAARRRSGRVGAGGVCTRQITRRDASGRRPMRWATLFAIALGWLAAGCSGRTPARPAAPLDVAIEIPDELRDCRYEPLERFSLDDGSSRLSRPPVTGDRQISVAVGGAATEDLTGVLVQTFVVSDRAPDLVA